jgi:dipeptidyl aminopeptidase/acylaminoacyl peptidase
MQRFVRSAAMLIAVAGSPLVAQQQPTVTAPADLGKWETLGAGTLSPDGKWVAYDIRRGNASTELRYRSIDSDNDHIVRSGSNPQFSNNNRWLVYTISPDNGGGRGGGGGGGGRGGRGGGAGGARNRVAVVDLKSGTTTTFDDIQSFTLNKAGTHVALRRSASPGRRGSDVIVRDLEAGTELTFGNVSELSWSEDGSLLALAVDVDGRTGNGVQLLNVHTGAIKSLDAGDAQYTGLVWRNHSADLAAMRSKADSAFADTAYVVLAWRGLAANPTKQVYDFSADRSFPSDMRVAAYRAPQWSDDGSTLVFGIAPREPKAIVIDRRASGDLPPARVQVWHAKDVREFHQQEVNSTQDRQRTMPVAWHLGSASVARLSGDLNENVQFAEGANVALATDDAPYSKEYMSGRAVRDVYTVDPATGKRNKILTKSAFGASLSPSGKKAVFQEGPQWWSLDIASGVRANLTGKIKGSFVNMEDDHPVPERRAYGLAGFTTGEKSVIVYDRFDLWEVNLDGSNPVRLTRGREDSTVYRCATEAGAGGGRGRGGAGVGSRSAPCQLDGDSRTIDTSKPLILTATGEYNKKSGYARLSVGQPIQKLIWADKQIANIRKADSADVYLFEQQSYEDSPNFFLANGSFTNTKEISHTNAFQKDYAWGKQVLMDYSNRRGDKLQMMLTYPANYEPGKKYPMVVYYYEKLSQGFHQYVTPSERNPYNTTNFSQNGYFVLRPDVVFQARNPGYSGLDCVESAVKTALAKVSDIDASRVGNMGHSWGGYQSAFYAAHNHGTFAATIAGAPLTDLISFYGYTSGNSGLPETGHFETGQERMQVSLWEDPMAYVRNSTVLSIDSLHTPMLLEEGDADGNVNSFQSQELYNFARRLGKNVVYLVYEGENHNVARPESQADYTTRQLEWFAHYLKGEPAAQWITEGETYQSRQRILKDGSATGGGTPVQAGAPVPRSGRP